MEKVVQLFQQDSARPLFSIGLGNCVVIFGHGDHAPTILEEKSHGGSDAWRVGGVIRGDSESVLVVGRSQENGTMTLTAPTEGCDGWELVRDEGHGLHMIHDGDLGIFRRSGFPPKPISKSLMPNEAMIFYREGKPYFAVTNPSNPRV